MAPCEYLAPRRPYAIKQPHDAIVAAVPTTLTGHPEWAYLSSGTWSLLGVEVADAVLTEKALRYNVTNEGGIGGTYRLLKNIMGLWLVQQCRAAWQPAHTENTLSEDNKSCSRLWSQRSPW